MNTWPTPMPIETAPMDGTEILGWHEDGSFSEWHQMSWVDHPDASGWYGWDDRNYYPTHWLPLPPAPERKP